MHMYLDGRQPRRSGIANRGVGVVWEVGRGTCDAVLWGATSTLWPWS